MSNPHLSPTTRWITWLSACRRWAAFTRHGNTVHTCESLHLAYVGKPVLACEYTTPLPDRRTV